MTTVFIFLLFAFLGAGLFLIQRERGLRQTLERRTGDLGRELKSALERFEEERSRLQTTFSGMVEGVLLTDERGDIVHVNPAFQEMFGLKGKAEGRSALEVLSSVASDDAIRAVIEKGRPVEREIIFEKPKQRVYRVHFSPVRRQGKLSGVVSVFHDLTEIRRLEAVRRDFIANLSHELKTPLTAIRGYAETLLEECRGGFQTRPYTPEDRSGTSPPEFRKHVEIIFRHATELSHLMENLLNLSRIESGREEVVLEKIDLLTFVNQIFERFQSQARVKGIELINEIGGETPDLEADPGKLNQILSNLIDNAIKYIPSPPGNGKVWVRAYVKNKTGDRQTAPSSQVCLPPERCQSPVSLEGSDGLAGFPSVCIEVEDNGPGIPEPDRRRIFERFYRVDKARSRDSGSAGWPGAGLGLSIVKHLVELHGGEIGLNAGAWGGAKFVISFPSRS